MPLITPLITSIHFIMEEVFIEEFIEHNIWVSINCQLLVNPFMNRKIINRSRKSLEYIFKASKYLLTHWIRVVFPINYKKKPRVYDVVISVYLPLLKNPHKITLKALTGQFRWAKTWSIRPILRLQARDSVSFHGGR